MPLFIPQHTPPQLDSFTAAYLECAEWLIDEDTSRECIIGWASESIDKARTLCTKFQENNQEALYEFYNVTGLTPTNAGHDLWLTRNGHGSGYWERKAGRAGDQLTDAAHDLKECWVVLGDDKQLYFEGGQ